jgi:hypothetical protein
MIRRLPPLAAKRTGSGSSSSKIIQVDPLQDRPYCARSALECVVASCRSWLLGYLGVALKVAPCVTFSWPAACWVRLRGRTP